MWDGAKKRKSPPFAPKVHGRSGWGTRKGKGENRSLTAVRQKRATGFGMTTKIQNKQAAPLRKRCAREAVSSLLAQAE